MYDSDREDLVLGRRHVAVIYELDDGMVLVDGLQTDAVCNEAIRAAVEEAAKRGEDVLLCDSDGDWLVHPDGSYDRQPIDTTDCEWCHAFPCCCPGLVGHRPQ